MQTICSLWKSHQDPFLFYFWFANPLAKTTPKKKKKIISKSPHISQRSFLCGGSDKQQKNRQWQQEEREKKRRHTHNQVKEDEVVTWLRVEQECDSCHQHTNQHWKCRTGQFTKNWLKILTSWNRKAAEYPPSSNINIHILCNKVFWSLMKAFCGQLMEI